MPFIEVRIYDIPTETGPIMLETYGDVTSKQARTIMERAPNVTYGGRRFPAQVKLILSADADILRILLHIREGEDHSNSSINLIDKILTM